MTEQFRVQQALFGYREGHNLVAASVALSPRVRHFLATITDGSGPETDEGFEVAYTGLPVPETDYYALFCTWPAPEMTRPGCVWSHVLLLDLADLSQIPDLSVLRKLCLRPSVPPQLAAYEQPLTLFAPDAAPGLEPPEEQHRATILLAALYGQPESGIVVLDEKGCLWEATVFGLWSQQWPRLRRTFAFSTGSLGDRRLAGVAFDLQVAPLSSQRFWGRGGPPTVVLEFSSKAPPSPPPPWVRTVLEDLRAGSAGSLRKFLFIYGSDVEAPRLAFARLVECFVEPEPGEDDDPAGRLAQLATAFPQPAEALSLKRDKLAVLTGKEKPLDPGHSWAAVYFLLQAREAVAFSRVPLDFGVHAGLLWQRKRADVLALLGRLPESTRATEFLDALADVLAPEEVPIIWHEQHAALPRIVARLPSLAATAAAWTMPAAGQQYLWKSLHAATSDPHTWALTCGAMLHAQCDFAERETVTLAGTYLTEGLLKWLTTGNIRLPSPTWRKALITPLTSALNEGTLSPPLLALAAWALSPAQASSLSGHRPDVQALARQGFDDVPAPLVLPTLFWLTTLGFKTPGRDGLCLLARAFFPVYDTVALSDYPSEAWEHLVPALPESALWLGWDRCRRLRHALRRWLRDNPGLADAMSHAAPTTEHAHLVQRLR